VLPQGGHIRGKDDVAGFFQNLGSIWEGLNIEVEDFVASGDRVCVIGKGSGAVNGTQTGYGFVHAWTVRDGAAVKFDEYADPAPDLYAR
jgi:ketosteroid isomerase-like protein